MAYIITCQVLQVWASYKRVALSLQLSFCSQMFSPGLSISPFCPSLCPILSPALMALILSVCLSVCLHVYSSASTPSSGPHSPPFQINLPFTRTIIWPVFSGEYLGMCLPLYPSCWLMMPQLASADNGGRRGHQAIGTAMSLGGAQQNCL